MATIQKRIREFLRSPFTCTASVSFKGRTDITTAVYFTGPVAMNAALTVSTITTVNSSLFFGRTTVASGIAVTSVAATIVKSNDWISISPILGGVAQTSLGLLCVQTLREGVGFTIGFADGGFYGGGPLTACWEIKHVG